MRTGIRLLGALAITAEWCQSLGMTDELLLGFGLPVYEKEATPMRLSGEEARRRLAGQVKPFHRVLVCRITDVTGWSASEE